MRRLLALVLLFPVAPCASAAESYDACAGFIDTLPATVSTQGVWCLRRDLTTSITNGAAIMIAANNVTLDCNGFKLGGLSAGPASLATGIYVESLNATVRNCAIRGFDAGMRLIGDRHVVEDNRIDQSLSLGLRIDGDSNLIQRNRIFDTGTEGRPALAIYAHADIRENTIAGVMGAWPEGIRADGMGTEVRGNRVRGLVPSGDSGAFGIVAMGIQQSIVDNRLLGGISQSLSGAGIHFSGGLGSFCRDNLISNFETGIYGCEDNGGNVVHGELSP